jgi:hypothetical protein
MQLYQDLLTVLGARFPLQGKGRPTITIKANVEGIGDLIS